MMIKRFKTQSDIRKAEVFLSEVDSVMARLIDEYGPCQITPWNLDLFTALISSIVSQQLSTKAAKTIFGRVLFLLDTDQVINPQDLASQAPEKLRECGLSAAKTRYVLGIANAAVSGELPFNEMYQMADDDIVSILTSQAGVGQWTAEMFLIFALGSPDVVSYADLGLKRGMMRYLEMDEYPESEQFHQTADKWHPNRSVASWYLWRLSE